MSEVDARTLDSVARFALPFPVAALYRNVLSRHQASGRLAASLRLAEGIVRFFALVALADASNGPGGASAGKLDDWCRALQRPGLGTWTNLLRSAHAQAERREGGAFLAELSPLLLAGSKWLDALATVTEARNRFAHDDLGLGEREAQALLDGLATPIHELLAGARCLRAYDLGEAEGLRRVGQGYTWAWYASRGTEEIGSFVAIRSREAPLTGVPLLLHPASGRALSLCPFFAYALSSAEGAAHLYLLNRLGPEPIFRHPVLRLDRPAGLARGDDPDAQVSVATWLAERQDWPHRLQLDLDDPSRQAVLGLQLPATPDERYAIDGKLGEGGMGSVWRVHDRVLGRDAALKLLHADLARNPVAVRRMAREAKVLAQLRHPGLVEVYDFGLGADGAPYLVMELAEGEDLARRVARDGPLPLAEAVDIVAEVAEIVGVVHRAGVIHRDLKPANIIVDGQRLRVLDFGIATPTGGTRYTAAVERMGTPGFMAPEQWRSEAGPQADVYALGQCLYFLLFGDTPPDQGGVTAIGSRAGASVAGVYATATALDPGHRYATMAEFQVALLAASAGAVPAREEDPVLLRLGRDFPPPVAEAAQAAMLAEAGAASLVRVIGVLVHVAALVALAELPSELSPALLGARVRRRPSLGAWAHVLEAAGQRPEAGLLGGAFRPPEARRLLLELVDLRNDVVDEHPAALARAQAALAELVNVAAALGTEWRVVDETEDTLAEGVYAPRDDGWLALSPWILPAPPDAGGLVYFRDLDGELPRYLDALGHPAPPEHIPPGVRALVRTRCGA